MTSLAADCGTRKEIYPDSVPDFVKRFKSSQIRGILNSDKIFCAKTRIGFTFRSKYVRYGFRKMSISTKLQFLLLFRKPLFYSDARYVIFQFYCRKKKDIFMYFIFNNFDTFFLIWLKIKLP